MATFISTVQFTEKGMQDIKSTCERAAAFQKSAEKMGAKVQNIFWTLGPFDGVVILEAADDQTATAVMLQLGAFGNVRTQTARAYQAEEMEQILGKLPG